MAESMHDEQLRRHREEWLEWRREIDARNARWDREAENRAWNNNSSV